MIYYCTKSLFLVIVIYYLHRFRMIKRFFQVKKLYFFLTKFLSNDFLSKNRRAVRLAEVTQYITIKRYYVRHYNTDTKIYLSYSVCTRARIFIEYINRRRNIIIGVICSSISIQYNSCIHYSLIHTLFIIIISIIIIIVRTTSCAIRTVRFADVMSMVNSEILTRV